MLFLKDIYSRLYNKYNNWTSVNQLQLKHIKIIQCSSKLISKKNDENLHKSSTHDPLQSQIIKPD